MWLTPETEIWKYAKMVDLSQVRLTITIKLHYQKILLPRVINQLWKILVGLALEMFSEIVWTECKGFWFSAIEIA